MKTHLVARALAACVLALVALVPATASARPGPQAEPIIMVGGFQADCNLLPRSSGTSGVNALVEARTVDGVRVDMPGKLGVQPLPKGWVVEFTAADGYNMCSATSVVLGRRFYDRLKAQIVKWNASLPAGYDRVTKVDVIGQSFGSTFTRSCIANAGRENPKNETSGCAALIDDWLAMVPPSHGTQTPWAIGCPFVFPTICSATNPGGDTLLKLNERFNGDVADKIGAGDETPQVSGPTPIEYTTLWAGGDGLIAPAQSAGLWGAANYRVQAGAVDDPTAKQLHHGNLGDPGLCPGSPDFGTSGTWEWTLWQLLDIGDHPAPPEESPRTYPTANAPFKALDCRSAPPGLTPWPGPAASTE